jgi:flagellin-like protein
MVLRIPAKNRKAISPVLATVILIAITLIAAVAIAGFVFGLFGSFTSSAQVSASVSLCAHTSNAKGPACLVTLRNTGTSNVAVTGCSLQISGVSRTGTTNGTLTVGASGTTLVACIVASGTAQTVGSQAVGSFAMSNGASVPISGVWS